MKPVLIPVLCAIALPVVAACAGAPGAVAPANEHQRTVTVQQPVNGDLFTAGQTIQVEGSVEGDVATAGDQIKLAAPVSGYVMAAGRNIVVESRIDNDLWAAGETVDVNGSIGDMATVAGRTVRLGRTAVVGDVARLAGAVVTVEGQVQRDLNISAATAVIDGQVGGDVQARGDRLTVLPGAVIDGDLIVRTTNPPDISPDARIGGEVHYEKARAGGFREWFTMWLVTFLALVILGLPIVAFAPVWASRIATMMASRFGSSMLAGLVLLILVPLAVVLLAVTVVGIPLAAVLAALYFVVLAASGVFVSFEIGTWLFGRMGRPSAAPWQRLTLGAAIVSVAVSLPAIGWLFAIVVVMLGVGALFLERRSARIATVS